jgi:hypothetical protein
MEQNSNMQTSKDKSDKKDMWDNLIYNIEWCYFYFIIIFQIMPIYLIFIP